MSKSNLPKTKQSNEDYKKNWDYWLAIALKLAEKASNQDEVPVGAVIIKNDEIIGSGFNRREQDQNPVAHAEILAIQEAAQTLGSWRLVDCTLVVTLEPCPMCLAACQQSRIHQVIYAAADAKGGALSLGYRLHEDLRTHHRFPVIHTENLACSQILKEFFQKKRN